MNTIKVNEVLLKMLFSDSVINSKYGIHIISNYNNLKKMLCDSIGVSNNISSKKLIELIGNILKQNHVDNEFLDISKRTTTYTFKIGSTQLRECTNDIETAYELAKAYKEHYNSYGKIILIGIQE